MQTALILEDHAETGQWLQQLLATAFPGITITLCSTCQAAREHIHQEQFNLALMDISLPDGNGIDLIAQLRQTSPHAYIIMSTIFDDDDHLLLALKTGAQGYLLKDMPEQIFVQKLRGILMGDPPLSPSIARKILHCFQTDGVKTASAGNKELCAPNESLTVREQEVLTLVAKGYSRKEIAGLLNLSSNTIARYVRDIYQKLNISSRAEAAVTACRMGLVSTENH